MDNWDFEFIFDPHDKFFGMTEEQWQYLHNCLVKVQFIPLENVERESRLKLGKTLVKLEEQT